MIQTTEQLDGIIFNGEKDADFEKALAEAWQHYQDNALLVDRFEDNFHECCFAKGFTAGIRFMLEHR